MRGHYSGFGALTFDVANVPVSLSLYETSLNFLIMRNGPHHRCCSFCELVDAKCRCSVDNHTRSPTLKLTWRRCVLAYSACFCCAASRCCLARSSDECSLVNIDSVSAC